MSDITLLSHNQFSNIQDIYLELGNLDAEIYCMRDNDLKYGNPFSGEYKELVKSYNKLCEKRRMLEEVILF